jgi:hypothetical protein
VDPAAVHPLKAVERSQVVLDLRDREITAEIRLAFLKLALAAVDRVQ